MASSILEQMRLKHEAMEVYEESIAEVLNEKTNGVSICSSSLSYFVFYMLIYMYYSKNQKLFNNIK